MEPVRAVMTVFVDQDTVLEKFRVSLNSSVGEERLPESGAVISTDQIFTRLEELVSNHLRGLCLKMTEQIKKQRITK